ncbi:MAG: hypothetical protein FWE24_03605 [Defluviitaleaceae bacterium]|nr:hypothetical protein [Defluviitaleaceae bacterium]
MDKQRHFGMRINDTTLKKFHYVAKYDDRSVSGQIMYLIHKSIRDFEKEHGVIEIEVSEEGED